MPTFFGTVAQQGVPRVPASMPTVGGFQDFGGVFERPYAISGVTRDASNNPLASVVVELFRTSDNSYVASTTSDASGAYVLPASNLFAHYLVAYKPGAPDVAGTTVNTLTGT